MDNSGVGLNNVVNLQNRSITMKRIEITIIAACFIAGLLVASAGAAPKSGGMGMGGCVEMCGGGGPAAGMGMWDGAHAMYVISALGLDDNQSTEVKAILLKLQKEMIQKRTDIQVAEIELREVIEKDPVDVKAAETKLKQIASLKTEAAMMHILGIEDVKAKLTPEQKKKLGEMMQMRGMGHGKAMMECPTMKGKMDMDRDTGAANAKPAKNKAPKAASPAHSLNQ
jgi:Spy/CpxP family protein refolding chaperone